MQKKRRAHQAHEEDNMTSTCCFVISRSAVRAREVALTRGTCAEPTALHKDPQDPPTLPQGTNTTTHRTSFLASEAPAGAEGPHGAGPAGASGRGIGGGR